jgi:hypothetical protein
MKKLLLSTFAIFAFAAISFGQATATAKGTVIPATGITKTADLDFGNVATGAAGTIALSAAGVRTPSAGLIVTGTPVVASFALVGGATQPYSFTIPTIGIAANGPGTAMTVSGWNSIPSSVGGDGNGVLSGGTGTILVGATLNVGANQTPGTYTTVPFDVTVNFQ